MILDTLKDNNDLTLTLQTCAEEKRVIDGSVPVQRAPHRSVGLCQAEIAAIEVGSGARCFAASHLAVGVTLFVPKK